MSRPQPTLLVTLTGRDRPGVTSRLFSGLSAHDLTVLDVEQVVIRGHLVLGVLLACPDSPDLTAIHRQVAALADDLGMNVEITLGSGEQSRQRGRLHVTVLGSPGDKVGPVHIGPAKAEALTFTRHGRYINVIVRNPLADPRKYRAEFRAHGLNVSLKLLPVSPSIVGTVVYFGGTGTGAIKVITARGRCFTGGGGSACPVGLRVPVDFRGQADLVFGRAARAGERYESTASATALGEVLHGLRISGKRVSVVLRMLRRRHVTAAEFHITTARGIGKLVSAIPGSWYVYTADPWAAGQVMLWAGRTRHPAPALEPRPAPVPSRSSLPAPAPSATSAPAPSGT